MTAREDILARIRETNTERVPPAREAHAYRRQTGLSHDETLARFAQRLADYHVGVLRAADDTAVAGVATARLAERGIASLVVPADLPASWRPALADIREDHALTHSALDSVAGVMTACRLGIAESGSILLDGGPGQGRRAITLLPDYHLCVIRVGDVLGLLPEAVSAMEAAVAGGFPLTFFSGPSATADIELDRVEGVHGPRTLDVILLG